MTGFLTYLLKVALCSGLLTGYYFVALRNRAFHQWNRFYLLSAVVLSLTLPLLTFTIFHNGDDKGTAIQLLEAVGSGDEYVVYVTRNHAPLLSLEQGLTLLYLAGSIALSIGLVASLLKVRALIRRHAVQTVQNIQFIDADVKGTPFSFFRYIFWNPSIDLQSENGQRIFRHELAHVRERHSLDKLLLQVVLIGFWCNPFFWLIRHELRMIHEFIADRKALNQQDASALAAMILQAAYPTRYNQLINSFFHQSLKRRLHMLAKHQNPRISYISRILFIPLAASLVLAFSVRTKPAVINRYTGEKVTVVIDPGHGGLDKGARYDDQLESDLVLSIAREIKSLNSNKNIEIILTRSREESVDLIDRVAVAQKNKASMFISLHVDALPADADTQAKTSNTGFTVVIPRDPPSYLQQSKVLGSALVQQLQSAYTTTPLLIQRGRGIFVLNKNICPAVMIECGYINNENDFRFIAQKDNQQLIAQKILNGIETYLTTPETEILPVRQPDGTVQKDTVPTTKAASLDKGFHGLVIVDGKEYKGDLQKIDPKAIQSMNVLKDAAATGKYGSKGKNGVIEITLKKPLKEFKGLVMVDDVEYKGDLEKIDPSTIQSMNVLKGEAATKKYGDRGREGVIEITLKPKASGEPTFTQVETPAQFPGGVTGWRSFLQKNLNAAVPVDHGAPEGQYTVMAQLRIEKDGTLSEIKPLTHHGYGMEEEIVRTLKLSPKWIPAQENGHAVIAYQRQPITFVISSGGNNTVQPPVTLRSGDTLTVAQLQVLPFSLLVKPYSGDYKIPLTNTMVPSAGYTVGGVFITNCNKGDVHEVPFSDDQPNDHIQRLIANAASGDIIAIDKRKGHTKDGQEFKMPGLIYYIK